MVDHDNAAFSFFGITFLSIYVLSAGSWLLLRLVCQVCCAAKRSKLPQARTAAEAKAFGQLKEKHISIKSLCTPAFACNLVFVVVAVLTITSFLSNVESGLAQYDPYQVLGVDHGSSDSAIKRAYRKLSLVYHPDKNPGDAKAEAMFMKVAKAYEALTDPVAKENWERYGNPDGKTAMEVGIGLPSWIMEGGNQKTFVFMYLGLLLLIVPAGLFYWRYRSNKYGDGGFLRQTQSDFTQALANKDRLPVDQIPMCISVAGEFREVAPWRPQEGPYFMQLYTKLKNGVTNGAIKRLPKDLEKSLLLKPVSLLGAHMLRVPLEHPVLQKDLRAMLQQSSRLVFLLFDIARGHQEYRRQVEMMRMAQAGIDPRTRPNTTQGYGKTIISLVEFHQHLVQALSPDASQLLQLPHLGEREIKHIQKGKHSANKLRDYVQIPDSDKKGLRDLTEEQKQEILDLCRTLPVLDVSVRTIVDVGLGEGEDDDLAELLDDEEAFVKKGDKGSGESEEDSSEQNGEDNDGSGQGTPVASDAQSGSKSSGKLHDALDENIIAAGDIATVEVTIRRPGLEEGEVPPPVHAPYWPQVVSDDWWLLLHDPSHNRIVHASKTSASGPVTVIKDIKLPVASAGQYSFELLIKSVGYVGLDVKIPVTLTVLPRSQVAAVEAHPDDDLVSEDEYGDEEESSSDSESDAEEGEA